MLHDFIRQVKDCFLLIVFNEPQIVQNESEHTLLKDLDLVKGSPVLVDMSDASRTSSESPSLTSLPELSLTSTSSTSSNSPQSDQPAYRYFAIDEIADMDDETLFEVIKEEYGEYGLCMSFLIFHLI
jgi:hypothetical protein